MYDTTPSPRRLRSSSWPVLLATVVLPLVAPALARAQAPAAPTPAAAAAPAATSCITSECHADVSPADARHTKEGITCVKCHANVPDGQAPHEDALDGLPPEQICAQCHTDESRATAAGPHKDAPCSKCHGDSHAQFTRVDFSSCKECHSEAVAAFQESIHAKGKKPAVCTDCHGDLHAVRKNSDPLSPVSKIMQVSTCGECHTTEYTRAFRTSVHGEGLLRSGLAVAPTCSDCHGGHDTRAVKDPASRVGPAKSVETCGQCHTFVMDRWRRSIHGQIWARTYAPPANDAKAAPAPAAPGDAPKEAPVCVTCHAGHRTFDPMVEGNHLKMVERCAECHKSQSRSYRETFHGKATKLGLPVAATCANCHTPHEMLPPEDPKSTVHASNLTATCGQCHQPINASFVKFKPHLDPTTPSVDKGGDPIIYRVWLFMTGLLLFTALFFGVHTLLWLQRSVVALVRGEIHRHRGIPPVWVRRFRPVHTRLHIVLMTTFLLLAATGLPLKFSSFEWASSVSVIFGGPAVTRWIHRACGIVIFAYSIFYAAYLIREIAFKGRRELLWGWKSMVPNFKDLIDLRDNLRWFLHLGPPPRLDRWSYWEKFDFFAVFWGIPVIGLSGLVLWAPLWFTQFFPGWWLNIAYLVHSDEALLATGFIFLVHFFHTHLRPESFPLDPVIFLGRMPLDRLKDERPVEYEHLKESGELEQQIAPAPTERELRRAYRIGAVALTTGVLLGIFLVAASIRMFTH